jgi:hypothetical protein
MKLIRLLLLLGCVFATTVGAQAPSPESRGTSPVEIRTSVDRTAVWVGDPVTYLVELRCAPKVDLLADDLAAERLQLRGLELLGVQVERDASVPDRITHRLRYRLAAYDAEAPALSVGAIPVRYHIQQPGTRPEDLVPAGEVRVPPLALSLRSTIPEGSTAALRDARSLQPLPQWVRLARPVGIGLVVLAITPVALWGAALVARARQARSRGRVRQTRKQRLAALEEIKSLDTSSTEALRRAFAQLDAWVRSSLEHATGVAAMAMTPAEIGTAVTRPPRSVRIGQVQEVLVECERAKYAPEPPSSDRWHEVLQEAERSMGVDGR